MAFIRWVRSVVTRWVVGVTGGALIGLVALYSNLSARSVPPRIYEAIVVLALFEAMFLSWREQERGRITAETDLRMYTAPRINLEFDPTRVGFFKPATDIHGRNDIFIRILPTTITRVDKCVGYLDDVQIRVGEEWRPVGLNGRRPLHWSEVHERRTITGERPPEASEVSIVAGSPQFLDIASFVEGENRIRLAVDNLPVEVGRILLENPDAIFRCDIRIIGNPHVNTALSLAIQRTDRWNAPSVRVIDV